MVVGVTFVGGGVGAKFNPVHTFIAVVSLLGILLMLVGMFWVIEAFAAWPGTGLWSRGLLVGFSMHGFGLCDWTGRTRVRKMTRSCSVRCSLQTFAMGFHPSHTVWVAVRALSAQTASSCQCIASS